jgi:hypothetical protein
MHSDTTKPHHGNTLNQVPISDLNKIGTDEAIAVRAIDDHTQTILAGVTTSVPDHDVETIIERQDNPYSATTATTSIISIDADTWWQISDDDITDLSAQLDNRPPVKRHYRDEPSDPPPCSLAATNHHDVELIVPTPNGTGEYVTDYYPANYGTVVEIQTGPVVTPGHLLPDEYGSPP